MEGAALNAIRTVGDVMHRGVITCAPETPLVEVIRRMNQEHVHALVVTGPDGTAVGVVSQTDLLAAGFTSPYSEEFRGMAAWHLMSSPVIAVKTDVSLARAVAILQDRLIHRLVVVAGSGEEPAKPVGILSVTDLVRHLGEPAP